jgi:hypothetical protein
METRPDLAYALPIEGDPCLCQPRDRSTMIGARANHRARRSKRFAPPPTSARAGSAALPALPRFAFPGLLRKPLSTFGKLTPHVLRAPPKRCPRLGRRQRIISIVPIAPPPPPPRLRGFRAFSGQGRTKDEHSPSLADPGTLGGTWVGRGLGAKPTAPHRPA